MNKKELLDYTKFLNEMYGINLDEDMVTDDYLKSINSLPNDETSNVSQNEQLKSFCVCTESIEVNKINDTWICCKCNKPLVQKC